MPSILWSVVVPVKVATLAKTRLTSVPTTLRADLARAFALDCLAVVSGSPEVAEVVVVTDDPVVAASAVGWRVLPDPGHGLNAAVRHGVLSTGVQEGLAALAADLPALRKAELSEALRAAAQHDRTVVVDRHGTGTTMLASTTGTLEPRFGAASAAAHQVAGAVALASPWPSLRTDVDTPEDLDLAIGLGVGPATRAVLDRSAAHRSVG